MALSFDSRSSLLRALQCRHSADLRSSALVILWTYLFINCMNELTSLSLITRNQDLQVGLHARTRLQALGSYTVV